MKNLKKGFTLVELTVVMVILAILLGMTALMVFKYTTMEKNVIDARDRTQEISNIITLISDIVDDANEDNDYDLKIVDNGIYHDSTLLISFNIKHYVYKGETFAYEHIDNIILETNENNKKIIYLKVDDKIIKSFRLFKELEE